MISRTLNAMKTTAPANKMGIHSLSMNHDMGFAGRIIDKYSLTGKYFFQGISLTYLLMNQEEEQERTEDSPVYLALKLLMAINYQELYETVTSNREAYIANLTRVLDNHLNQLQISNPKAYEYIKNVYRIVSSRVDTAGRERIEYLLEEQVRQFVSNSQSLLTKEQTQTIKQINDRKKEIIIGHDTELRQNSNSKDVPDILINQGTDHLNSTGINDRRTDITDITGNALPDKSTAAVYADTDHSARQDNPYWNSPGQENTKVHLEYRNKSSEKNSITVNLHNTFDQGNQQQASILKDSRTETESSDRRLLPEPRNAAITGTDAQGRNRDDGRVPADKEAAVENAVRDNFTFSDGTSIRKSGFMTADNSTYIRSTSADGSEGEGRTSRENSSQEDIGPSKAEGRTETAADKSFGTARFDITNNQDIVYRISEDEEHTNIGTVINSNQESRLFVTADEDNQGSAEGDRSESNTVTGDKADTGEPGDTVIVNRDRAAGDGTGTENNSINITDITMPDSEAGTEFNSLIIESTQIDEFLQSLDHTAFHPDNAFRRNISADAGEEAEPGKTEEIFYDNNILVNVLHKNNQGLTLEDKKSFYTILRQLGISNETQERLTDVIEKELTGSPDYRIVLERLRDVFSTENGRAGFLKEIYQNGIKTASVIRLLEHMTSQGSLVLHKEKLMKFFSANPAQLKGPLEFIQKELNSSKAFTGPIDNDQQWFNNASQAEVIRFLQVLAQKEPRAFEKIVKQRILEANIERVTVNEHDSTITKEYRLGQSSNNLLKLDEINNFPVLADEVQLQEYFTKLNLHSHINKNLFSGWLGILGQPDRVKEKLIDIIETGDHYENEYLLNRIIKSGTIEETDTFHNESYEQKSVENSISRTDELVYIIRNADTGKLKELVKLISGSRLYRESFSKAILPEYHISGIQKYQQKLLTQYSRKESKEKLITAIMGSTGHERSLVTELVKNVIGQEELIGLMKKNPELFTGSPELLRSEALTCIIRNISNLQFTQLLKLLQERNIFDERVTEEISGRLYQNHSFVNMTTYVERIQQKQDKYRLSSIGRNRKRQIARDRESFLKEKMVHLITGGRETDNAKILRMLETQLPGEELTEFFQEHKESTEKITKGSGEGYVTHRLITYIRTADKERLDKVAELIHEHPVYSQRLGQVMKEVLIRDKAIENQTEMTRHTFKSSIISNKLRLEQRRIRADIDTKEKLDDLLEHGSSAEIKNLYEYIGQHRVLLNARNEVSRTWKVYETEEAAADYVKRIIHKAGSQELKEFLMAYQEEINRKKTLVEHNIQEQTDLTVNTLQQSILLQETDRQELDLEDRRQPSIRSTMQNVLHQDILLKNLLLQKSILEEDRYQDIDSNGPDKLQRQTALQSADHILADTSMHHKQERHSEAKEEAVKKIVDEYITAEQVQMKFSHNNSSETQNELNIQKKEIRKLKENLQVQSKIVEDLKKQAVTNKNTEDKIDINQISRDVMKKMEQQILVARMRKGLD